ncbi:MAG TPA: lytic transglycosylase domain-containing protein [Candidatus Acidoferrales bacterium]
MTKNCIPVAVLVAGSCLLLGSPLRAQITSTVDEHGKRVFVNADSPKPRHGSTISFPRTLSPAAPDFPAPSFTEMRTDSSTGETLGAKDGSLDRIVRDAAARHNMDPALVKAVISTESGWNPQAVSNKGAVGLMQLVPGTAQRFGVGNPFDPAQNVEGGTTYLKSLLDRYDGDISKTLAAYNAGEGAVDRSGGVPRYRETQRYVQKVQDAYFRSDSGRSSSPWFPPKKQVRKDVDANGRATFTNQ